MLDKRKLHENKDYFFFNFKMGITFTEIEHQKWDFLHK